MASIGGLDVGFGAQMQVVRTNVLVLKADTNDYTSADLQKVHNLATQRFPAALRPDYTCGVTDAAGTTALASDITDDVEGGLLKSITTVPVAGGKSYGSNSSNEYRGLSVEAILSVGALTIQDAATSTADDLFDEGSSPADSPAALNLRGEFTTTVDVQGSLMAAIMNDAESGYNTQPVVSTLSYAGILNDAFDSMTGSVTDTEIDGLTDDSEAASTAGSTLLELKAVLDLGSTLISTVSLCKVA